ncbi:hypothetical protein PIB30_074415 [Stylosanthes scabra]|uniref:Uncharacterized protein n=1 Tax=Stylosanthes scabra TaxID=79078 RepID=A0ABU6URF4_9FABA|nr:hypothetical protein [Stylosanthes scabra]
MRNEVDQSSATTTTGDTAMRLETQRSSEGVDPITKLHGEETQKQKDKAMQELTSLKQHLLEKRLVNIN